MTEQTTLIEPTTDIAALPPADRALIVLSSTKTEADLKAASAAVAAARSAGKAQAAAPAKRRPASKKVAGAAEG